MKKLYFCQLVAAFTHFGACGMGRVKPSCWTQPKNHCGEVPWKTTQWTTVLDKISRWQPTFHFQLTAVPEKTKIQLRSFQQIVSLSQSFQWLAFWWGKPIETVWHSCDYPLSLKQNWRTWHDPEKISSCTKTRQAPKSRDETVTTRTQFKLFSIFVDPVLTLPTRRV